MPIGKVLNKVGGLFGLGGGQGDYYQNPALNSEAKKQIDASLKMATNADLNKAGSRLAQGDMSLADILGAANATGDQSAALSYLASSPVVGSALASQQVIEDPLLAGLFGDDSTMSRAVAEERDLASRGFSLQPEDHEAYGQMSGELARMFGQEEQSLASALANRGLAAGSSGVAAQQFAGLQGNKSERLAGLQRQIANDRMQMNLQRLSQTRQFMNQLGGLGQEAQGQKFAQNNARMDQLQRQQGLDTNQYQAEQAAAQASQASKEANRKLGLADAIGGGVFKGIEGGISAGLGGMIGGNPFSSGATAEPSVRKNSKAYTASEKKDLGSMW